MYDLCKMSSKFDDSLGGVEYQLYRARFLELENKPMLQRILVESYENRRNDYKAWYVSKSPVFEDDNEEEGNDNEEEGNDNEEEGNDHEEEGNKK
jgi:hypothetical protein